MKLKACIFDLDGVIVDTAKYHYLAWKRLAQELKIPFDEIDNEKLKGVSRMTSLDLLLRKGDKEYSEEEKKELAARKNFWYLELCSCINEKEILPGVKAFFNLLQENEILIGLGSASKNARLIIDKLKLTAYFNSIVDGNKITKAKPHPQIFLRVAEELKVHPEDVIVFEDAEAGVEAAIRGGFYCVGIGHAGRLERADIVLSSTSEMSSSLLEVIV
jgi:beta-phosphoglucomutase